MNQNIEKKGNRHRKLNGMILFTYLILFTTIFGIVQITPVEQYVQTLKQSSVQVYSEESHLKAKLNEWAEKINRAPIDARIDRIWKAIPGYNGRQVNLEKSYKIAEKLGYVNQSTLIVEEIEPSKQLSDLALQPIYRGNPEKNMVSLMINVAWGTEYVPQMLNILDQYHSKATFFLDGKWLRKNKELAFEIVQRGHEIGNHAYSHPDMARLSADRIRDEIVKTEKLIRDLGIKSHFFAPPSGSYDERVVKIAEEYHMKVILWTLDTVDWQRPSKEIITQRIVPKLEKGSFILMHPTESTVEALPEIIKGAFQKELLLGTLSELVSSERAGTIVRLD